MEVESKVLLHSYLSHFHNDHSTTSAGRLAPGVYQISKLGPSDVLKQPRINGILASPLFPIYVVNIKKGKHGSDSGAYDSEGRFVPEKFEEIFQKHALTYPNALTEVEVAEMLKANQEPNDSSRLHRRYMESCV